MALPTGGRPVRPAVHGRVEHTDGRPFAGRPAHGDDRRRRAGGRRHQRRRRAVRGAGRARQPTSSSPARRAASRTPAGRWVPDGAAAEPADFVLDGDGLLYGRVARRDRRGRHAARRRRDRRRRRGHRGPTAATRSPGCAAARYTATAVVPGTAPVAHQVQVLPGDAREYDLGLVRPRSTGPAEVDRPGRRAGAPAERPATRRVPPGCIPVAMVRGGTGIAGLPNGTVRARTPPVDGGGHVPNRPTGGGVASDPNPGRIIS